jgi:hypothetical protein
MLLPGVTRLARSFKRALALATLSSLVITARTVEFRPVPTWAIELRTVSAWIIELRAVPARAIELWTVTKRTLRLWAIPEFRTLIGTAPLLALAPRLFVAALVAVTARAITEILARSTVRGTT